MSNSAKVTSVEGVLTGSVIEPCRSTPIVTAVYSRYEITVCL